MRARVVLLAVLAVPAFAGTASQGAGRYAPMDLSAVREVSADEYFLAFAPRRPAGKPGCALCHGRGTVVAHRYGNAAGGNFCNDCCRKVHFSHWHAPCPRCNAPRGGAFAPAAAEKDGAAARRAKATTRSDVDRELPPAAPDPDADFLRLCRVLESSGGNGMFENALADFRRQGMAEDEISMLVEDARNYVRNRESERTLARMQAEAEARRKKWEHEVEMMEFANEQAIREIRDKQHERELERIDRTTTTYGLSRYRFLHPGDSVTVNGVRVYPDAVTWDPGLADSQDIPHVPYDSGIYGGGDATVNVSIDK